MDCREISQLDKKYDALMIGFCLPYLSKEEAIALIKNAKKVIKKGGALYLSTMEGDYTTSGPESSSKGDLIFMHYHEAGYLTEALEENGFTVLSLERKIYPGPKDKPVTDLIIIVGRI
jgi:hypothetical protein